MMTKNNTFLCKICSLIVNNSIIIVATPVITGIVFKC
jgi:hypothetical protein